jgi:hypothetical protein
MSALAPKADIRGAKENLRYGPQADIVLQSDFCRCGGENVVGRQRPTDAFELEFANWFDVFGIFNRHKTRGLIKICPGLASSQSLDATWIPCR